MTDTPPCIDCGSQLTFIRIAGRCIGCSEAAERARLEERRQELQAHEAQLAEHIASLLRLEGEYPPRFKK